MKSKIAARVPRMWHIVDAKGQVVGRLAAQITKLLMGKHKPTFVPHVDNGDYVVVINAKDAVLTGDKMKNKMYRWHTGWMGGLKELTARQLHERAPDRIIQKAVQGMMTGNLLRKHRLRRLRIFADDAHVHQRQIVESERYAPEHLALAHPKPVPAGRGSTSKSTDAGSLIKDYFGTTSQSVIKAKEDELVYEDPLAHLEEVKALLAKRKAAVEDLSQELR